MKKLLVILICIFTFFTLSGCANASFDVKTVTLDGKFERFGELENCFFPALRDDGYIDDNGTIVALWREDYHAYPETQIRQYLLRISPDGSYTKTLIYDSGLTDAYETLLSVESVGIFNNPRGNTVLVYNMTTANIKAGDKEPNVTFIFEEFDYNFNQVNKVQYGETYTMLMNNAFVAMDDNGYFYSGSQLNAHVYSPDFEYLGEITGLPKVNDEPVYDDEPRYDVELFVPVTGSDGAAYIYKYADKEPRAFYKIDPLTLTAKKVFTLSADKTHTVWRGDMRDGALFYTSGETPQNKFGLMKISKNGMAAPLMYLEDIDTENNIYMEDIIYAQISDNGNFYYLTIEDSDDGSETKGDDVRKIISFIRN
jgi:hypothetical protein